MAGIFGIVVAGALIGAAVNVAVTIGVSVFQGNKLSVGDLVLFATTGAIRGMLTSSGLSVKAIVAASAAVGVVGSIVSDIALRKETDSNKICDNAVRNGIISGLAGYLGGKGIANGNKAFIYAQKEYNKNLLSYLGTIGKSVIKRNGNNAVRLAKGTLTASGKVCRQLASPKLAETTSAFVNSCLVGTMLSGSFYGGKNTDTSHRRMSGYMR